MAGKLFLAEEVFLIVRELSETRGGYFSWADWQLAWEMCSPSLPWQSNKKKGMKRRKVSGLMSISAALKAQVCHGTIERHGRGNYSFIASRPARPLFDRSKFRPYKDTVDRWAKARWGSP